MLMPRYIHTCIPKGQSDHIISKVCLNEACVHFQMLKEKKISKYISALKGALKPLVYSGYHTYVMCMII